MEFTKWIVAAVAVFNCGGFVADALVPWSAKQHLWNPNWPPHAKFHNCQTMLMGIGMACLSLTMLFGFGPLTRPRFLLASATAGLYFVSMLLAPAFPGTDWVDPEFKAETPRIHGFPPQKFISLVVCSLLLLAVGLT